MNCFVYCVYITPLRAYNVICIHCFVYCGHTKKWMSSQIVFLLILDVVRENYV
jgi:hypothetical protein